jgi:hypothetical protein
VQEREDLVSDGIAYSRLRMNVHSSLREEWIRDCEAWPGKCETNLWDWMAQGLRRPLDAIVVGVEGFYNLTSTFAHMMGSQMILMLDKLANRVMIYDDASKGLRDDLGTLEGMTHDESSMRDAFADWREVHRHLVDREIQLHSRARCGE